MARQDEAERDMWEQQQREEAEMKRKKAII